ncbi:MAG: hypothetical protein S0880_26840 [Actinomycetota bacterium]|nr:hypothetical protein [Actinomycetota bacterium]
MTATFTPSSVRTFRHLGVDVDPASGTVALRYGFDDTHTFTEVVELPPFADLPAPRRAALGRVLDLLHLAAGVSYHKAALASRVTIERPATAAELDLVARLYRYGLAELRWRNRLPLDDEPVIEAAEIVHPSPVDGVVLAHRPLVPVGGGKDSAVALEVARAAGAGEPLAFSVGRHRPIDATIEVAGVEAVHVRRRIDPALIALNDHGAINGHVPVTAVVSLLALATALIVGADDVLFANERSASAPNLVADGIGVNHQWSKGRDFEVLLAGLVATHVTPELGYRSVLRPVSELGILAIFAGLPQYHPVFTSCNRVFAIREENRATSWCGNCDKCRFVTLGLAPFLPRAEVTAILGADLLDDPTQRAGFAELCELDGHKPFECVGEASESRFAAVAAAKRVDWASAGVLAELAERSAPLVDEATARAEVFGLSDDHDVSPAHLAVLDAALRPHR